MQRVTQHHRQPRETAAAAADGMNHRVTKTPISAGQPPPPATNLTPGSPPVTVWHLTTGPRRRPRPSLVSVGVVDCRSRPDRRQLIARVASRPGTSTPRFPDTWETRTGDLRDVRLSGPVPDSRQVLSMMFRPPELPGRGYRCSRGGRGEEQRMRQSPPRRVVLDLSVGLVKARNFFRKNRGQDRAGWSH